MKILELTSLWCGVIMSPVSKQWNTFCISKHSTQFMLSLDRGGRSQSLCSNYLISTGPVFGQDLMSTIDKAISFIVIKGAEFLMSS